MADTVFRERHVDADGFRIRYMEAGAGVPLVHLHGAGGLRLTPAHELLARQFRVVAFEMPGFGDSPVNTRTETMAEMASTIARTIVDAISAMVSVRVFTGESPKPGISNATTRNWRARSSCAGVSRNPPAPCRWTSGTPTPASMYRIRKPSASTCRSRNAVSAMSAPL